MVSLFQFVYMFSGSNSAWWQTQLTEPSHQPQILSCLSVCLFIHSLPFLSCFVSFFFLCLDIMSLCSPGWPPSLAFPALAFECWDYRDVPIFLQVLSLCSLPGPPCHFVTTVFPVCYLFFLFILGLFCVWVLPVLAAGCLSQVHRLLTGLDRCFPLCKHL